MKYTVSNHTLYDADEELFFTKVGIGNKLLYTAWGITEKESKDNAQNIVEYKIHIENLQDQIQFLEGRLESRTAISNGQILC